MTQRNGRGLEKESVLGPIVTRVERGRGHKEKVARLLKGLTDRAKTTGGVVPKIFKEAEYASLDKIIVESGWNQDMRDFVRTKFPMAGIAELEETGSEDTANIFLPVESEGIFTRSPCFDLFILLCAICSCGSLLYLFFYQ